MQWILPDVVTFSTSIILFIIIKKASIRRRDEQENLRSVAAGNSESPERDQNCSGPMTRKRYKALRRLGLLSSIVSLCSAGIIQPSVVNGVYFLSFLGSSTWLSTNRKLGGRFAVFLKIISVVLMFHITAIILYQIPIFQEMLQEENLLFRVLFRTLKIYSSTSIEEMPNHLGFNMDLNIEVYINPFILMITYFIITSTSFFILVSLTISEVFIL